MSEEIQVRPGVMQVGDIKVGFYLSQDRTRAWISLVDMLAVEAGGKGEGISGSYVVQNCQKKNGEIPKYLTKLPKLKKDGEPSRVWIWHYDASTYPGAFGLNQENSDRIIRLLHAPIMEILKNMQQAH